MTVPGTDFKKCQRPARWTVTWPHPDGPPSLTYVCNDHARNLRELAARRGISSDVKWDPAPEHSACQHLLLWGYE